MTDLAPIIDNLAENVRLNAGLFGADGFPSVGVLDWSIPTPRTGLNDEGGEKEKGAKAKGEVEKREGDMGEIGDMEKSSTQETHPLPQNNGPGSPIPEDGKYDLILSSDPLYSPSHPAWLAQTVLRCFSAPHPASSPPPPASPPDPIPPAPTKPPPILIIELPLRTAYLPQVHELRARLREGGLELLDQGEEVGREDWGGGDGKGEVRCWWGVWGWVS